MDLELANRSVLVTGASSGIGLAAAQVFVQEGARVAICARGAERLEAARRQLDPQGKSGVLAIAADLSQPSAALALAQQVTSNQGPVEVLVNNVGGPPPGNNNSIDDASWARAVELTLMSAVRMARAVLPGMRARRWGRIVNVSSTSVKQPIDNLLLSNSIRLAVLGWAKTLANEVAADNVLVNTVCPGWTRTPRVQQVLDASAPQAAAGGRSAEASVIREVPLRRMAEPREIADVSAFLASARASYLSGVAVPVDGGMVQAY